MDLDFSIDSEEIAEKIEGIKKEVKQDVEEAVGNLANMTHAKLNELASTELKSLSKLYMDNIEFENPAKGLWVVTLKEPAVWIDEDRQSGFMKELLTVEKPGSVGKIKQGKEGKYRVIPFVHSKNPSEQSPKAQALANQIRQVMEDKGISWKKIEKDESGSPRTGLLHRFNIDSAKLDPKHKTSPLQSVSVYQKKNKETGIIEKHSVTFRVISEKHEQEGLWNHPGRPGSKLMEKSFDWAMNTWEKDILPAIFRKYE